VIATLAEQQNVNKKYYYYSSAAAVDMETFSRYEPINIYLAGQYVVV
jgi:hypothetical protein